MKLIAPFRLKRSICSSEAVLFEIGLRIQLRHQDLRRMPPCKKLRNRNNAGEIIAGRRISFFFNLIDCGMFRMKSDTHFTPKEMS